MQIAEQVQGLCSAGGFPLAKWQSNSANLLKSFAPDRVSSEKHLYEESDTKILGLIWRPVSDTLERRLLGLLGGVSQESDKVI